jgi:hypothetical protein
MAGKANLTPLPAETRTKNAQTRHPNPSPAGYPGRFINLGNRLMNPEAFSKSGGQRLTRTVQEFFEGTGF